MTNSFSLFEVVLVLAIIGIIAFVPYAGKNECDAKASRIGFPHEWSFFGGCMIEEKPGLWIPLNNYRKLSV